MKKTLTPFWLALTLALPGILSCAKHSSSAAVNPPSADQVGQNSDQTSDVPISCDQTWLSTVGSQYGAAATDLYTDVHLQACIAAAAKNLPRHTVISLPVGSRWLIKKPVNINASELTLQTATNGGPDPYCFSDYTGNDSSIDATGKINYRLNPALGGQITIDNYTAADATNTLWPAEYGIVKGAIRLRSSSCATLVAAPGLMACSGQTSVTSPNCAQLAQYASYVNNNIGGAGGGLTALSTENDLALINIRGTYDRPSNVVTPIVNVKLRRLIIDGNAYNRQKTWTDQYGAANPVTALLGPCMIYSEQGCGNLWVKYADHFVMDGIVSYNTPGPALGQVVTTPATTANILYNGTGYNIFIEDCDAPTIINNLALRSGSLFPTFAAPNFGAFSTYARPGRGSEAFTFDTTVRDVRNFYVTNNYVIDSTDGSLGFSATNGKAMLGNHTKNKGVFDNHLWQWTFMNVGGVMAVEAGRQLHYQGTGSYQFSDGDYLEFSNNDIDCNKGSLQFPKTGGNVMAKLCFYGLMLGNFQHQPGPTDSLLGLHYWSGGSFHNNNVYNARLAYTVNASLLAGTPPSVWGNHAYNPLVGFNGYMGNFTANDSVDMTDPTHIFQPDTGTVKADGTSSNGVSQYLVNSSNVNPNLPNGWTPSAIFNCIAGCPPAVPYP